MRKTILDEWISQRYLDYTFARKLRKNYLKQKPFLHHTLAGFFVNKKINAVRKSLLKQQFERKEADLFSFHQTQDIRYSKNRVLKSFYKLFNSKEFHEYVTLLTGAKLGKALDMSGFIYSDSDYLLPHDDRLETRKVAFVVNLSRGFMKRDGGSLGMFTTRGGHPVRMTKTYTPQFNTLFLFTVTRKSFHQVNEVLSNKKRLSFGGWFHGMD